MYGLIILLLFISFLQAHTAQDPKLAKGMYLPLAERMTLKYIKEDKIEAEAGK